MRGRQLVWSDKEIRKLSREFVTVTDEVYMLYPEDEWNLKRVQDTEEHKFFKRFGEAMPEGDWNHPGTKQGLYMIGPDAEYLEGRFAASGFPDDIKQRLKRALKRWKKLRKDKGYANEPVPAVQTSAPPRVAGEEFVLRVHSRDLPRGDGKQYRFDQKKHQNDGWMKFTNWAWNENWLAVDDWRALVPEGDGAESVDAEVVQRIAREVLIDNVRGQAGKWKQQAVKSVELTMTRGKPRRWRLPITYRGEVVLDDGQRSIRLQIYGEGVYEQQRHELVEFELVALGMRKGAHRFNQRKNDQGPAPIGFTLRRWQPPQQKSKPEAGRERPKDRVVRAEGPSAPNPWPSARWRRVTEQRGLDRDPLDNLGKAVDQGVYGPVDRLFVLRKGAVVFDRSWQHDYAKKGRGKRLGIGLGAGVEYDIELPADYNYLDATRHPYRNGTELHSLQSVTKSVASLLVGIAMQQGKLGGVDTKVLPLLQAHAPKDVDARLANVSLADVLTMRSGIEWHEHDRPLDHTNTTIQLESSENWLRFVLSRPFDAAPGTSWVYSSGGSHLLSGILHAATGMHVDTFAEKFLFEPLGIRSHHWKKDPQGFADCEGGLYLRAEDLARIGYLMLKDGVWAGRRIVPNGWVEESTRQHAKVPGRGYGYQWWREHRGQQPVWAALGFGGQHLLVLPEHDIVAVALGWNVFGDQTEWLEGALVKALMAAV